MAYYVSKMSDQSSDEERPTRRASPVSENTLFRNIIESGVGYVDDLSDSFVSNISDSETSDDAKSESEGGITGIKRSVFMYKHRRKCAAYIGMTAISST
ncbi:hypothetical protein J6590_090836 [Homalodisca vitripennis]|nr:hypothetical protein J6590_090836 [Homalodisca vitripennis]